MYEALANWQLWIVSGLLLSAIWIKVRIEQYRSYRNGVVQGFLAGVSFTLQSVTDSNLITDPSNGNIPLTEEEIIRKLAPMLTADLMKKDVKPKV